MDFFIQNLRAPNNNMGNPRRCWVVYEGETGQIVNVYDEGYEGVFAIPESIRNSRMRYLQPVDVSATEYKRFLKLTT